MNKHIDCSWSEPIEEGVCDEIQTVLDKADGTPPIVENPDGLDFEIGGNANKVGPGISYNDNPEELLDTIDMNHMRILNIEPTGFQTFEHRFNGPSFLVSRKGFFRVAEGYEDLRFGSPGLVFNDGAGKIEEFATDTIDKVQDTFFSVSEIGKDMLRPYLSTCSEILHPEVVTDADMVLDRVVVEPLEPFVTDELPVCDQAFDAVTTKQAYEPLHDIDSLLAVRVPAFGQEPEQDWERHMIIRYAQN